MNKTMQDYIEDLFGNYLESQMSLADYLPDCIALAAKKIVECLLQDGKILICGSGASAANALHFSIGMMHQFHVERPALPAIVLTQDFASNSTNYNDFEHVFARQIQALGNEKDLLLMLTTSGDASCLIQAVDAAKERGMDILILSGKNGGVIHNHLGPDDLEIKVKLDNPARIRETHLFILHGLCELVDQSLFGALR